MSINLSALMKQRYDTAANWTAQNPTLLAGEIGIESDTKKWKVGTGATAWTSLTYAIGGTYPLVNADIAAGAEIAVSKLADGSARQLLQTDAAGTGVEWTSDVSIPGVLAVTAGTAALPGIAVSGDLNTGIYSPGADQLAISTGGIGKVFVDASGNVAIAQSLTPSFTKSLNISALNAAIALRANSGGTYADQGIFFAVDGTTYAQIYNEGVGQLIFRTGSGLSERTRIDSSGRLLMGTSSAFEVISGFSGVKQQIVGNDAAGFLRYSADASCETLWLCKSRNATAGQHTVLQGNDGIARFNFQGSDGTSFITAARIDAEVDGTPGTNDMPGRLVFSTTADGAASPTEALRITNDRVLAYNQPTPATYAAAATLTVADLKTKIITYTGANATLTLPTGTLTEGGFSGIYTNMAFEWSVINTGGAGNCTIGAGTAHTIVGSAIVIIGTSGRFASRRTAANTFVSYRLS